MHGVESQSLWHNAVGLVPVQRDAHMTRGAARGHAVKDHAVQRQTQGIGLTAVDGNDAPLDAAIIAPTQNRTGHAMGAPRGKIKADQQQR